MPGYSIDANTKLFAKMNGTGATFVDSSAQAHTITANGNATQITKKLSNTAMFFDGSTAFIDIANSADFAPGTGAFTTEFFFMTTAPATAQVIYDTRTATADTTGFYIGLASSKLVFETATTARITGATTIVAYTWYHVMVVGNGGGSGSRTVIMYLNAVQEGSTYTNDYNFSEQTLRIGAIKASAGTYFTGWFKELRTSNVARSAAVPTSEYSPDANTVLLLHGDTKAIQPLCPAIYSPSGVNSVTTPDSADWHVGTGQFCIDGWIKPTAGGANYFLFDSTNAGTVTGIYAGISTNANAIELVLGATIILNVSYTFVLNTWYHVVIQRDGSDKCACWINGQQIGASVSSSSYNISGGYATAYLLQENSGTSANSIGYYKNIRFSNIARHTDTVNFTPSSAPITLDSNTKLLLAATENNGVTAFIDSSASAHALTVASGVSIRYTEDYRNTIFVDSETTPKYPYPSGLAKIDFVAPFGSGVGYFDGTGDYLSVADSADWDFSTADLTIDTYVKWLVVGTSYLIQRNTDADYSLQYNTGNLIWKTASAAKLTVAFTPIANTWYHITFIRVSGVDKMFVNGTIQATTAADVVDYTTANAINIGTSVNGFLENFRMTKGVALYTATFNPPYELSGATFKSLIL